MAVRFDATGEGLSRTSSPPSTAGFTVCGWANLSTDRNTYQILSSIDNGSTEYAEIGTDADGTTLYIFNHGAIGASLGALTIGTPFFWAQTVNGSGSGNHVGYGRNAGTNTLTTASQSGVAAIASQTFWVGRDGFDSGAYYFDGRIWNVKVWDRVLTAAELLVESFYQEIKFTASKHLHWRLPNASNTTDSSGLGRDATVTGTLSTEDGSHGLWKPSRRIFIPAAAGGGVVTADGSTSITFSATAVGASRAASAGSSTIVVGVTGVGAARGASAGSTSLVFDVTGVGQGVTSAGGSAGITFGMTGVGASRASGAGSTAIVFSQTGVGAASQGAAGSTSITLDALGAGASSVVAAGSTAIVFDVQGVGAAVSLGAAAGSIDIALGVQGVGAAGASGDGATSIVLSQAGEGASRIGAAGSTGITFDALGAGAASAGAAGSTSIVFDAQGVGASAAAGTADGRADIVFDAQGVGAARVSGEGSAGLVFDAPGEGASRASAAGLQQIVFDVQGVGFESAPTVVSADGSASIVIGMFGDTTQAAAASEGGKVRGRVRRVPVAYDEEAELMEIMAAALPMLRARGMLWDR